MFNRRFRQTPIMNVPQQDGFIDIDNNTGNIDIDFAQSQTTSTNVNNMGTMEMGPAQAPIMEPVQERIVHRNIEHVVPHVCPIRTKVINHHIYKHTYQPSYSCCEENVCENVQCGSCCNF